MPLLLLKQLPRFDCLLQAANRYPDLDPCATSAFLNLLRTGDLIFDSEAACLSNSGLSQGRFSILMLLNRHPDVPQTPAALADQSGVTRATITGLLDTLEKDGLVERSPADNDRRCVLVRLTSKGASLMDALLPGYFRHVAELLSPLTPDERSQLVELLQKLQAGLDSSPEAPCNPPL